MVQIDLKIEQITHRNDLKIAPTQTHHYCRYQHILHTKGTLNIIMEQINKYQLILLYIIKRNFCGNLVVVHDSMNNRILAHTQ